MVARISHVCCFVGVLSAESGCMFGEMRLLFMPDKCVCPLYRNVCLHASSQVPAKWSSWFEENGGVGGH